MDIIIYEGISYFLQQVGEKFDASIDENEYYRFSIRTNKSSGEVIKELENLANFYVRTEYNIVLAKISKMKNGLYNYVYILEI